MTELALNTNFERTYKNNGQHLEQVVRFTLTGEIVKADNKPAEECGDIWDIQVKSPKATVCKGDDVDAYLERDAANRYCFVLKSEPKAYIMSKAEWREFVSEFGCKSRASAKNGGYITIQLLDESKRMRAYLAERV